MSARKPSVLVTGGAGYLGSIMVPELLNAGYRVTVLDNFMFKQSPLNHLCSHPDFDVQRGDARDETVLKPLIKDADYVIPLAALVGAPLCNIDQPGAIGINRDAVVTLTRILSQQQRILMPITNSGYGIGESGKFCTEETPLRPISLYGRTKVEAEQAALARGNAISFRLATVFGMAPRMRLDLLVNDFVYVPDVTRAFLHGLANFKAMRDQAYNVGLSDANLSKQELCEKIREHLPAFVFPEAPVGEDPDKRDYIVSNAKIEATGFAPAFSLDAGIQELIKGYRMIRNSLYGNV